MFKLSGGKLAIILWLYVSEDEFLWFLNLPPTPLGDFELLSVIDNDRCLFFGRSEVQAAATDTTLVVFPVKTFCLYT